MTLFFAIQQLKKTLIILPLAWVLAVSSAFAIDLASAKSQGLVGEGNDGYLGYVVTPPSAAVKALVEDVNAKRRAIFERTAKKNNIAAKQVAGRFYERAIQKSAPGRYYQNASGRWVKK